MRLVGQVLLVSLAYANNIVVPDLRNRYFVNNVGESPIDDEQSRILINEYQQKICNHSDTCSLIDQVPPSYRDLRKRNCMCDKKCTEYGDCCPDSKYHAAHQPSLNNFSCVKTAANGYVYMITSCPHKWKKSRDIRENCETLDPLLTTLDVWLFTPVTDSKTAITYRNMFCAFCHEIFDFDFWKLGLTCDAQQNEGEPAVLQTAPTLDESMLAAVQPNETYLGFWEYHAANTTYRCFYHGLAAEEAVTLRYCVPAVVDTCNSSWTSPSNCSHYTSYVFAEGKAYKNPDCLACNYVSRTATTCNQPAPTRANFSLVVDPLNELIQKIPRCPQIPKNTSAHEKICSSKKENAAPVGVTECKRSSRCLLDGYFEVATDISYLDANKTRIYIKSRDQEYPDTEWLLVNQTTIYVCGRQIARTKIQRIFDSLDEWISEILVKLSIVCLVLHLLIFQQLPEMKNLSGKNLAIFCSWLLVALLCFEIGPRLPRCEIVAVVLHYSLLSCFTWMLIMSYDCWLSLYRATKKFRAAGGKHSSKFAFYCLLSCLLPAAVIAVALYFELSPPSVISCQKKLGYGKYKQCFIGQVFGFVTFFIIPASTMFLFNVCFFAHTAYMIFLSQRSTVNPNTRNDFKLYTRLALMMGLTWTLGSLLFVSDSLIIGLLFSLLNMSQGIFIFFGFTFKTKTLKQLLVKHKDNPKISTFLSTFVRESSSDSGATQNTQLENMRT